MSEAFRAQQGSRKRGKAHRGQAPVPSEGGGKKSKIFCAITSSGLSEWVRWGDSEARASQGLALASLTERGVMDLPARHIDGSEK